MLGDCEAPQNIDDCTLTKRMAPLKFLPMTSAMEAGTDWSS